MAEASKKTCFISAPFGFDASPLMEALAARNVTSTRLDDLALGESIVTRVQDEIRQSDFVCVVFPGGYGQSHVIFEAGLALGRGRPVLILVESDVDVPFELGQLTYVRTTLSDQRALGKVLDTYLPELRRRAPHRARPADPGLKPLGKQEAEEAIRSLSDPHEVSETRLAEIVAGVFRKVGILASPPQRAGTERGPDLAVWIDETQSIFGNPVFVETKVGDLTQSKIDDAYHDLSRHLIRAKLLLGLVIYLDKNGKRFKAPAANLPLVACLSAEEVIDSLRLGEFTQTLLDIRNRAVHGVVA